MKDPCYNSPMRKPRGLALVSSMFLAMTVLFMVTVMFATQKMDFQATALSGEKLARQYQARAACAETVVAMTQNSDWEQYLDAEPLVLDEYDPPVSVFIKSDPQYYHLIHVRAVCNGEESLRVLRDGSQAESMIFTSAASDSTGEKSFYKMARRETRSSGRQTPWNSLVPPPSMVYGADGSLTRTTADTTQNYAADFRGRFYSIVSGVDGFALYEHSGGDGWTRLPARPAVSFHANGSRQLHSKYVAADNSHVLVDAHKDGTGLYFVENVPQGAGLPNGAALLQKYDTEQKTWSVQDLPPQSILGGDGRYQVKDLALGSQERIYLLTEPTSSSPSQILSYSDGNWTVVPAPKENYFTPDGQRVQTNQSMTVESLTVDTHNNLLASSPTSLSRWYTVSKLEGNRWTMALDDPNAMSDLTVRNLAGSPGFKPISVDSGDLLIVGNRGEIAMGRVDLGFTQSVLPLFTSIMSHSSRVGGGIQAEPNSSYVTTAEY